MNRSLIFSFIFLIVSLLVQVIIFRQLVLFNTTYCFVYVTFILLQPYDTRPVILMLMAFILGIAVDVFYDSLGLHSMSLVCIAYLRKPWLNLIVISGGHEKKIDLQARTKDIFWFIVYAIPLIFIHHFILFFTEVGGFGLFWFTLLKATTSAVFTMTTVLIISFLFIKKKR